jgi:polyphosphate kinase
MSQRRQSLFSNRELSWLEFNARVLEEAQDPANPVLERLRFYCIFHSNLDEFFMVRVASVVRQIREADPKPDASGMTPDQLLERMLAKVRALVESAGRLYEEKLVPALAKQKIQILAAGQLGEAQRRYVDEYCEREIQPILTPLAIDQSHTMPRLSALAIYLAVLLEPLKEGETGRRLAVVQVPARIPGLIRLPEASGVEVCWLTDAVRLRLEALFAGYRVVEVSGFRVTRDSELELDDEGQESYVRMLETELKKRQRATPIRVECEASMSEELRNSIVEGLGVSQPALIAVRGPLDPRPLLALVEMPGFDKLRYAPQPPLMPAVFDQERGIFDIVREQDILLHHPYDSFDPVVEFLETAADDPDVLAIKQTLYRASGKSSPVLGALARAAEKGKQVTVLVELMARFDEERNIGWARDLEDAGAHVLYGVSGLKVHAKVILVVRREGGGIRRYVHLGTGNYNERTARVYTDLGLLTADPEIGRDASGFFNTITGYSEPPAFTHLVMAPIGMRDRIISLIRREADRARSGQPVGILAKVNSLVDSKIIEELYAASSAGVPIRLNIRGICCLRPGVQEVSENIQVISIVDRYLEHSRIIVFRNGGSTEVYASSADWMPRNLDRRVELMFPILRPELRDRVVDMLEEQFADNQRARRLKPDGSYERVSPGKAEPVRVQEGLYRRAVAEAERVRSVTPVRFAPIEGN